MRESEQDWLCLGRDPAARGLPVPLLVVSDGAPGLVNAVEQLWPSADRQRCTVHRCATCSPSWPSGSASASGSRTGAPLMTPSRSRTANGACASSSGSSTLAATPQRPLPRRRPRRGGRTPALSATHRCGRPGRKGPHPIETGTGRRFKSNPRSHATSYLETNRCPSPLGHESRPTTTQPFDRPACQRGKRTQLGTTRDDLPQPTDPDKQRNLWASASRRSLWLTGRPDHPALGALGPHPDSDRRHPCRGGHRPTRSYSFEGAGNGPI